MLSRKEREREREGRCFYVESINNIDCEREREIGGGNKGNIYGNEAERERAGIDEV